MTAGSELRLLPLVMLAAVATTVSAQAPSAADEAFKQGRELLKAGKYAEACAQFDNSQRLDPQLGTLFNIGECSQRIGRLATARAAYRELVDKDTNATRHAASVARYSALEPRVPKLIVMIDKPPRGVKVSLDSKLGPRDIEANKLIEVDLGEYTVVVRARGFSEFIAKIKITEEARTTTVEAALAPGASNSEIVLSNNHDPVAASRSRRMRFAIMGIATGGAAVIGGVLFGVLASSQWSEAKTVCGGTACANQADVDRANAIGDNARSKATLSTAFMIGGAVLGGVGVYLWLTMPGETRVTPQVGTSGGGVALSGQF